MEQNEHDTRAGGGALPAPTGALLHASAVAVGEFGVLILGRSGSGKSGLALRLMALGAALVADDRVSLRREGNQVIASAPGAIAGLVEARGVGIIRVEARAEVPVALAVDLDVAPEARMPQQRKIALLGRATDFLWGRDVPHLDAIITVLAQTRWGVI